MSISRCFRLAVHSLCVYFRQAGSISQVAPNHGRDTVIRNLIKLKRKIVFNFRLRYG